MKAFCLPKEAINQFIKRLQDGTITPDKLSAMTSDERHKLLADILGEDNATNVNALFESKLLLKDQQSGMIRWVESILGDRNPASKELLARVNRMEKVLSTAETDNFLKELAAAKLGVKVNQDDVKAIYNLSKEANTLREKIPSDSPIGSKERLEYGVKIVALKDYVGGLKLKGEKLSLMQWVKSPGEWVKTIGGTLKSMVASLDDSFFGRQGIKVLYTNPNIWVKDFLKSWVDIGKQLTSDFGKKGWWKSGDDAAMTALKADIYSRPNALNGKYEAMNLGIGIKSEEAFPSSIPERIPLLGRLFKASEVAYNGAALRMRADLADKVIPSLERNGINVLDKAESKGAGSLVNSMTGRGNLGKAEALSGELNAGFFSIKFLKSNFDTLTAHMFDKGANKYVRKMAATNLLKIAGSIAAILTTAKLLDPNSTDLDPNGSGFGKIRWGNTTFDVTGGMGSIVTLLARLTPQYRNGEWGFYTKNSKTGKVTKLNSGTYGAQTALDVIDSFWQGKLSPIAGILRDIWKGEDYSGNKTTIYNLFKNTATPMMIQNVKDMQNTPDSANVWIGSILDAIGISTSTYSPTKTTTYLNDKNSNSFFRSIGVPGDVSPDLQDLLKKISKEGNTINEPASNTTIKPTKAKDSRTMTSEELKSYRDIYQETLKKSLVKYKEKLMNTTGNDFDKLMESIKTDTTKSSKDKLIKTKNIQSNAGSNKEILNRLKSRIG